MAAVNALTAAKSGEDRNAALNRLRAALKSGNHDDLSLTIRRLLDGKTNAPTGQGSKIRSNGSLLETPTLRTLLLNTQAQICYLLRIGNIDVGEYGCGCGTCFRAVRNGPGKDVALPICWDACVWPIAIVVARSHGPFARTSQWPHNADDTQPSPE